MSKEKLRVTDLNPVLQTLRAIQQRLVAIDNIQTQQGNVITVHETLIAQYLSDRHPNAVDERIDKLSFTLQETQQLLERLEARIASNELNIDHLKTELL